MATQTMSQTEAIRNVLEKEFQKPAQEVVDLLAKKGIKTNINLVNSTRYRMRKEQEGDAKPQGREKPKSYYIRLYFKQKGVDAPAAKVIAALAKKGITDVSENLVNTVRSGYKKSGDSEAREENAAVTTAVSGDDLADALKLRSVLKDFGGKDRLLRLMDFLAKMETPA